MTAGVVGRSQASNRVMCMVNSFVLAGLLNRTLIASFQTHQQEHTGMDRHVFLDIEHLRSCYGENAIITAREYKAKYGEAPVVDAVMCWGFFRDACKVNMKNFDKMYSDMGIGDHVRLERADASRIYHASRIHESLWGGKS